MTLTGLVEHDREAGTRRIQVRLARGSLRPLLRMRLDIDRESASSTVVELIPCGRVRPTAAYFRAGHLLLDLLTRCSTCLRPMPVTQRASRTCPSVLGVLNIAKLQRPPPA